jgi:DNA-binding FadR family transcriptional regulator
MGGCSANSAMLRLHTNKLHRQIAPNIACDIVSKRLAAGAIVPSEPQLVSTYGVSKTVARETVQVLEAAGLVRIQHGKRTVVLDEEDWDILCSLVQEAYRAEHLAGALISELYEVRLQLEPRAAGWAALRANERQVEQILQKLEAMRQSLSATQSFLEHDREFHLAIVRAASNRVLRAVLRDIHELLITSWVLTELSVEDVQTVFEQHERIALAIRRAQARNAERAMRDHLEWAIEKDHFLDGRIGRTRIRSRT